MKNKERKTKRQAANKAVTGRALCLGCKAKAMTLCSVPPQKETTFESLLMFYANAIARQPERCTVKHNQCNFTLCMETFIAPLLCFINQG